MLVFLFYVTTEMKDGLLNRDDNVYHIGHILGAVCGLVFGYLLWQYPTAVPDYVSQITAFVPNVFRG